MKRAILFKGEFAYALDDAFLTPLSAGLEQLGIETRWFDLKDPADRARTQDPAVYRDADFVLAMNGIKASGDEGDFRYFRDTGCVFVSMLIDPPLIHRPRLTSNADIITCIDRGHVRFLDRYFTLESAPRFFPHGGCRRARTESESERSYDILFAGTFSNPAAIYKQIEQISIREVRQVLFDAIELLLASDTMPPFAALEKATAAYGADLTEDRDLFNIFAQHYRLLDSFIRAEKRLRCLFALDRAGLSVDIWGNRWPLRLFKNHRVHLPCSLDEILFLMTRAKTVLDLGMYEDGSHERVFSAMRSGAVAVAMDNPYHREVLKDGATAVMYQFTTFDQLADRLSGLLANRSAMDRIAAAGNEEAERRHSWEVRAGMLVNLVEVYRQSRS